MSLFPKKVECSFNHLKRELVAQVEMKIFIMNSGMETSMYKP